MGLTVFNTATRSLEPFEPGEPPKVTVYGCGPTLYGPAHVGNFRSFVFYDLVHRYLAWRGFEVRFVMNFTDVDDKTIQGAQGSGHSLQDYTAPFGRAFLDEADALGIRRLDAYPRATESVDAMVALVERLVERDLAYATDDGSVFFSISAFPRYGDLCGRDLEQARVGDRVASDEYQKEDARDFALWKAAKPEDERVGAAWDAPWGRGRPGWHLECSVLAMSHLGETIDLHLGGEDLVFPHHENEIAQSEGATGKPFARYWIHVKHLKVEGKKMSKSLGNFIRVRDLLEEGVSPVAIRHLLLSAHHRSELNFTRDGLDASARSVERLVSLQTRLHDHPTAADAEPTSVPETAAGAVRAFREAMDDDLNAPAAMGVLFVFVNRLNGILDAHPTLRPSEKEEAKAALGSMDEVLGLLELAAADSPADPDLAAWVEERIEARKAARAARDWGAADAIRDELTARGIVLEDGATGTRWKQVSGS